MKSRFTTSTNVTVRFSDTDAMGHCNNRNYFSFMEEGRVAYLKRLYPDNTWSNFHESFPFIVADIQCTFKTPAFCNETLCVSLGVTRFGEKSFDIEYDIHELTTQRLVATGKSVQVMYDYKTKKSVPVSDEFKTRVESLK